MANIAQVVYFFTQTSAITFMGLNEYFVMIPAGELAAFETSESETIQWIDINDAGRYINMTRNVIGRNRDFKVLDAAVAAYMLY